MKYVRPFSLDQLGAGEAGPWLLGPDATAGCTVRLRRGGGTDDTPTIKPAERFGVVLRGRAEAVSGEESVSAPTGGVLFLPAGRAGALRGASDAIWLEIEADAADESAAAGPLAVAADESKFLGELFRHQSILDSSKGVQTLKMNAMQVDAGAGSPDFHIHAFTQMYIIQEGEMTVDVGRWRFKAPANSFVYLPAGVVHRNFNASGALERHVSVLFPEPKPGQVFDYAVDIHEREAELITSLPA